MCFADTYTCSLYCVNAEFPMGQTIALENITRMHEQIRYGCSLTCTAVEHFNEWGAPQFAPPSDLYVLHAFIVSNPMLVTLMIIAAILIPATMINYWVYMKGKDK